MTTQLTLSFDEVPLTCPVQKRYHAIAPCLAGRLAPADQAAALNLSFHTITRWLHQFRDKGMPGLFPAGHYPREPYTPERVVATLLHFKCCAPSASDRELARAVGAATNHRLHNETVKALLARYPFWRSTEFRLKYPAPADLLALRLEMVKLHEQGWTDQTIAILLGCNRKTVIKWVRRWKEEQVLQAGAEQMWLLDHSHAAPNRQRKVYFGTIHAVLELQKKYAGAGWFRIQGYLAQDYRIELGETTIKKIMALNRRLHLAPPRPVKLEPARDPRQGPPKSQHPFEHTFIDLRYLDAKPAGKQLYSCLLLEGYSRTILAGSLTLQQHVGIVLRIYYLALLQCGGWEEVISDHGGQFRSHAFARVNRRLRIEHQMYEKGQPWRNLIEAQFGIQARVGEYQWEHCQSVDEAVEVHRALIRDHNRLPHFAHRKRDDQKQTPLEVLGAARGREIDAATLHRAFSRMSWQRTTDGRGFVRINRWRIYVEEGLAKTPVQVTYWDGRLRAEYRAHTLAEYHCRWDNSAHRPRTISHPQHYENPFQTRQQTLFDPCWIRDPMEEESAACAQKRVAAGGKQLRLYLGPELVK